MSEFKKYIEKNKESWNKRTPVHYSSNFYDLESFKKGETSLKSMELNALGDVNGKSMLHLQCHFGQDTLSWARMGADITGVDLSDQSIDTAKSLSQEINVDAEFINQDVLELDLQKEFDIVFSSYGAIGWLPDLKKWGATVAKHLKKGGTFLLVEFHPFIDLLDETKYDYFYKAKPDQELEIGTYTDGGTDLKHENCWWNHSLSEVFVALESNGLKLQSFEEFDHSPYHLRGMVKKEEGKFVMQGREKQALPYVFSVKATKK